MLPEELNLVLRKYQNKTFIYAWEYFTRRIHDELIRSVLEKSPFFYIEVSFNVVQKELHTSTDRAKFWEALFEVLSTQKRYSDMCGFLSNDDGIAFMFVDSAPGLNSKESNPVWNRFCSEVESRTFFDMRKWEEVIYAEYPPKGFFAANNSADNL